ncbi:hypothetical protein D6T64_05650 [Cryobacterium melibiosiphilum]|uniref:Uncharacterized protein n=1 Tax=Cryobacterium melibiosiphilum TaxID=995039 RepID=A0A3A5MPS2_9MICO|nr:hypothetical protein [Cryobacterium melibiosiphilum]RJT89819.1 hypothetical protein D6T64_05650 [Cryobacterium melibiosiphilum]
MTTITIDAGTLTANQEDRIVTGLLLPYGEECRSNLGRFAFDQGAVTIPADLSGMSFNVEHARENVIGRPVSLTDTSAGIVASFSIAKTDAGNAALADIASGKRKHLSAEVSGVKIKDGKGVAGDLFAAALVAAPAFPSATLLAAAVDTFDPAPADAPADPLILTPDENGNLAVESTTTPESVTVTAEGSETIFTSEDQTPKEGAPVAVATAPATLTATRTEPVTTLPSLFSILANSIKTGDKTLLAGIEKEIDGAESLFAALSDVKMTGTGTVGSNIVQPQFLGELWSGRAYQRKVIPLLGSGVLTSPEVKGWRWTTEPEVALWAGNKAAISSNAPATEAYSVAVQRIAGAHDIAREFRDFGVAEFWASYFAAMTESYAKVSDKYVFDQLVLAATAVTGGAVPSGTDKGLASIVDGALSVLNADGTPSFALVAPDVWRGLLFTQDQDKLAFLNASLGLEEGSITNFKVVPHKGLAAGKVLVGDRNAAAVHELGGSPIRVEGLDLVKGGIDPALFGYVAVPVHKATALALVTPAV